MTKRKGHQVSNSVQGVSETPAEKFKAFERTMFDSNRSMLVCKFCGHKGMRSNGVGGDPNVFGAKLLQVECTECKKRCRLEDALNASSLTSAAEEYRKFKQAVSDEFNGLEISRKKPKQVTLMNFLPKDMKEKLEITDDQENTDEVICLDPGNQAGVQVPVSGNVENVAFENVALVQKLDTQDPNKVIITILQKQLANSETEKKELREMISNLQEEIKQLRALFEGKQSPKFSFGSPATLSPSNNSTNLPKFVFTGKPNGNSQEFTFTAPKITNTVLDTVKKTKENVQKNSVIIDGKERTVLLKDKSLQANNSTKNTTLDTKQEKGKEKKTWAKVASELKNGTKVISQKRILNALKPRETPLEFRRIHVHLTDSRLLKRAATPKEKNSIAWAVARKIGIRPWVFQVSIIGNSVVELYVRSDSIAQIEEKALALKVNINFDPEVMHIPSYSMASNIRARVVKRLGHLYKNATLNNLKKCILEGLDDELIQSIKALSQAQRDAIVVDRENFNGTSAESGTAEEPIALLEMEVDAALRH